MKIAFINSSLEPGRDGVGDYTRLLSQECVRQGHSCYRIALSDRFINEMQWTDNSDGVAELRLSAHWPWSKRIEQVQVRLNGFEPDWVSLQFVPYGFHPKGLPFGLANHLRALCEEYRTQIMFHELWVGEPAGSPLRHRLIGRVQKRIMLHMIKTLQPAILHTSNDIYINILKRNGVTARRLPLFGNIPVASKNVDDWLFHELRVAGLDITPKNRDQFWLAGFFGSLPPDWPSEPFFTQLSKAADELGRQVAVLSVGNFVRADSVWNGLQKCYAPKFAFCRLGPQPEEKVSQYLQALDFGILTTSYQRIGKSGSAAAMLDHGLPVFASDFEQFPALPSVPANVEPLLYKIEDTQKALSSRLPHEPPCPRLPIIAAQFIAHLERQYNNAPMAMGSPAKSLGGAC